MGRERQPDFFLPIVMGEGLVPYFNVSSMHSVHACVIAKAATLLLQNLTQLLA